MKRVLLSFLALVFVTANWQVDQAFAGTDITVTCNSTTCTTTPDAVPLFHETNLWPGYSVTQQITATNTTADNGQLGLDTTEILEQREQEVSPYLATSIFVEIHQGTVDGPIVYGGGSTTLYDLFQANQIELGTIDPNQTQQYFFKSTISPTLDNNFMGTSAVFDLDLGFNFTPVPGPGPGPGPDGNPGGGGGGGGGSTAGAAVCSDTAPSSAPALLSAISGAGGQVTLNWTGVAGASHYAINFGIQPGVYLYGNSNVGNVTSYVVNGLSPGNQYFFQVIPINGCAPGPRSNEISTGGTLLPPGSAVGGPAGFAADQVLGETTDASGEAQPSGEENTGEVLGEDTCAVWKPYMPVVLLLVQIIISFLIYVVVRNPENKPKQIAVIIVVIAATGIFYYIRNCDCAQASFLSLLCQWYIIVAIATAFITQFINYSLIERED